MRRAIFPFFSPLVFMCVSCTDQASQANAGYDYMVFERGGGGSLVFQATPSVSAAAFDISVDQLDFRDTTIRMTLFSISSTTTAFNSLTRALRGECNITGDFKRDTLCTGTWVTTSLVREGHNTEVTNIELRSELSKFESIVRDRL